MVEQGEKKLDISGVMYLIGDIFGGDGFFAANFGELCIAIESALASLPDRECRILELRYGLRNGLPARLMRLEKSLV